MLELLTAIGAMFLLGVIAWYFGSLLLRVAAFWRFLGAGLLLVACQGDISPWAAPRCYLGRRLLDTRSRAAPPAPRLVGVTAGRPPVLRPAAAHGRADSQRPLVD